MKKIALTSLMAMFAVSAASAAVTPYASLKLGYANINKIDVKAYGTEIAEISRLDGYTGSIAGGASFDVSTMVGMRGELEYTYADTEENSYVTDPFKVSYSTVMANAYADFGDEAWIVKPYVGLGVGYSFGELSQNSISENVVGMAYSVSTGITYAVSPNVVMDLGAKYTMQDLAWDEHTQLEFDTPALSFLLGARYMF